MSINDNKPSIYESPDGGKTIYVRTFGCKEKQTMRSQYDRVANRIKNISEIITMAEHDDEINDLFEKIEVLYELKKPR